MRDYWLTQYLLAAVGWTYIVVCLVAIALALWLPKTKGGKTIAGAIVLALASIFPIQGFQEYRVAKTAADDYKVRLANAQALFDERCKTAGEKIYRTVENVEGIRLLNIRKSDVAGNRANQNWDEAGLPNESTGDGYIRNFLYWEHDRDSRNSRGYLNSYPSKLPGFNFVEAPTGDSQYLTYTLDKSDKDRPKLLTAPLSKSNARYAVSSKNISTAEDTAQWIAGIAVEITDTKTNELIAKGIWYAFERGLGSTAGFRQPWGFAVTCPSWHSWDSARTRFFVDQVLKPIRGE